MNELINGMYAIITLATIVAAFTAYGVHIARKPINCK